jgi:hypothetical protein
MRTELLQIDIDIVTCSYGNVTVISDFLIW